MLRYLAKRGITYVAASGTCCGAFAPDDALPLPGASVDRVLLIHSLELADSARREAGEEHRVVLEQIPLPELEQALQGRGEIETQQLHVRTTRRVEPFANHQTAAIEVGSLGQAVDVLSMRTYELVILEPRQPDGDGFAMLRRLPATWAAL